MLKAIVFVAAITLPGAAAAVEIGRCVIEVGGKTYLDGPCNYETDDIATTLGVGDTTRSPYFAYIMDDGTSYWNGPYQESHAGDPLGVLKKDGDCYVNADAKVCAYGRPND